VISRNIMTICPARYQARRRSSGGEIMVKVCGGYTVMTAAEYNTWRKQK
jgi:hypothetical protein